MIATARKIISRFGSPTGITLTYFLFGVVWIFASDRVLHSMVQDPVTISDLQTYKGWAYVSVTAALLYGLVMVLVMRMRGARERLRVARENFRRLVESSNDGMWAIDEDGHVYEANARLGEILGVKKEELLGRGIDRFVDPAAFSGSAPRPRDVEEEGAPRQEQLVEFRRASGESGWGVVARVCLKDGNGRTEREARILTDITGVKRTQDALRRSLDAERLLLNELDHRVRNNLASLLALIDQAKRQSTSVEDFAARMRGRIGAMAATHEMLADSKFASVDLRRLIGVITDGEPEGRIVCEGPPLLLGPLQAGPLAMIMQEMWTNSVKHGALGTDGGRARVSWEVSADNGQSRVGLRWREENGPAVSGPVQEGFGLSLVRGLATSDLHGGFEARFSPGGAEFHVEFPLGAHADGAGREPGKGGG